MPSGVFYLMIRANCQPHGPHLGKEKVALLAREWAVVVAGVVVVVRRSVVLAVAVVVEAYQLRPN